MSHTPTHDQIIEQLRSERDEARATLEDKQNEIDVYREIYKYSQNDIDILNAILNGRQNSIDILKNLHRTEIEQAKREGIRLGLKAAASEVRNNTVDDIFWAVLYADRVWKLDPDRILAEAQKESGDVR